MERTARMQESAPSHGRLVQTARNGGFSRDDALRAALQASGTAAVFVFPIVACAMGGLSYGTIFRRSLVVLPFVVFIGVFNLFYDREPVFRIRTLAVTAGWVVPFDRTARTAVGAGAARADRKHRLLRSLPEHAAAGGAGCFHHAAAFRLPLPLCFDRRGRGHAAGPRREGVSGADPIR